MGDFIYREFSDFVATRVRVENWLSTSEVRFSGFRLSLVALGITSCQNIGFSSLRSGIKAVRNSINRSTSMAKSIDESSHYF